MTGGIDPRAVLLAELEIFHSRPAQPTRRVALGHMVLPVDPAPGFGGLLLGAVVAQHLSGVDEDLVPDIHTLVNQVGNERSNADWAHLIAPADAAGVIAVGATAYQEDTNWPFSSQGPATWGHVLPWSDWDIEAGDALVKPDISAPGMGVSSLLRPNNYSQTNWNGTSMAAMSARPSLAVPADPRA